MPKDWNGDKIMHNVADVLTDPNIKWNKNKLVRGKQRYDATGVRDGVKIKVIVEPDGEGIVTAFPISGSGVVRNP